LAAEVCADFSLPACIFSLYSQNFSCAKATAWEIALFMRVVNSAGLKNLQK